MKLFCHVYLYGFILTLIAACASPVAKFKVESVQTLERVRASNMEALFPSQTQDFYRTVGQGDLDYTKGDVRGADLYYGLALGKAELLEILYLQELKKREEAARLDFEMKRQAEAELERQKMLDKEQFEQAALEAARLKKIEAEKAEARRRAERNRQEREVQPVTRHTVKRGETLPQIAALQEVYGDSSLWPLIYKSNRDQISNPAVLWPGQVLRIPRNFDKNDLSDARRFAADRSLR